MTEEHVQQEEQKEKKCNCPAGAPAWMVTYSDLVTLLLTFFVLLLSMASMDPVKFTKASSSIKDALGIHSTPSHVDFAIPVMPSPPITTFSPVRQQTTKKIYEKVRSQIESLRLTKQVGVFKRDDDSIVLRINESVLFKPGQSKISLKSYPILRTIADIIDPLPMDLRIEGHTDDKQVSRRSLGNWDLSVDRSVSVLRFFSQSDLLPLDRMASVGYGKDRPVIPNNDDAARALNRRVDFVLRLNTANTQRDSIQPYSTVPL